MAQDWPEWTGDLRQLYITIKLALSKFTFLLTPPKQADTIIICIPQRGRKVPFLFNPVWGNHPH